MGSRRKPSEQWRTYQARLETDDRRGELAPPGDSEAGARDDFFEAMRRVYPDPLKELQQNILPAFRRLAKGGQYIEHLIRYEKAEVVPREQRSDLDSKLVRIRADLRGWASRYNLTCNEEPAKWVLQFALRTLHHWSTRETARQSAEASYVAQLQSLADPLDLPITYRPARLDSGHNTLSLPVPGPNPIYETRHEHQRRVLPEVRRALNAEYDAAGQALVARGCRWPQRKRQAKHFEWAVLYQCARRRSGDIARRCSSKPDTVEDAVHRTLTLIGLTVRPGKRGPERRKT